MTRSSSAARIAAIAIESVTSATPSPLERLQAAGLRVTAPRLAVLGALPAGSHLGVDEIATTVRRHLGSLSTQAVYDILRAFGAAGLVRRVEPAGSPALFESRVGDNHHHVVCRACGRTQDIDCAVGATPCLQPASTLGYLVDEAEVTYWGWCPACREGRTDKGPDEGRTHQDRTHQDRTHQEGNSA